MTLTAPEREAVRARARRLGSYATLADACEAGAEALAAMRGPVNREAAADALRRHDQAGKRLNDWASLPRATQAKWLQKVEIVLGAALPQPPEDA